MATKHETSSSRTQRTTKDDPNFVDKFYKSSRLHFIGAWRERYQEILDSLPPPPFSHPPKPPHGIDRVVFHVDMDCFFAAVAAVGRPELADKPLAICHGSGNFDMSASEVDDVF